MSDHLHDARHGGLGTAIDLVQQAVTTPFGADAGAWSARLVAELDRLGEALEGHIARTEAPDGLLHEIVDEAPRLAPRVQRAVDEHATLRELLADARAGLPIGDVDAVLGVRDRTVDLLGALARHRDLGSELVFEAYNVDLEAAD